MSNSAIPDPRALRRAMGMFATGITIVTAMDKSARGAPRPVGLTVNSFASVSLDPPLVLWSLKKDSSDYEAFSRCDFFAVNVLCSEQLELCKHFAQKKTDRFKGMEVTPGEYGAPVFEGCCAIFECRNLRHYDGGDHIILIGRIERFERHEREPLVFHGGHYRALKHSGPVLE